MSVKKISHHFDGLGIVPVKIEEVILKIQEFVPDDKIIVNGIDAPPKGTLGLNYANRFIGIEELTPGSAIMPITHHRIVYSTRMDGRLQRLVVCKELLHILDSNPARTTNKEKVLQLAEGLLASHNGNNQAENPLEHFADKIAIWLSLIVLFPYGFWEVCRRDYRAGKITLDQIADVLEIPSSYIAVTMDDKWDQMREGFLSFQN